MIFKNSKSILIITILLIISLGLFAEDKVILKVFELPDPKRTDAFAKADMAVIKAFKEKYPHIELRSFSGITIEGMDLDSKPLMAIAGGVSPDILYINFRQSDTYIQNNFLYPLDEFINNEEDDLLEERVAAPVWPVINRQKTGDEDKKIWMLPYETLVRVMIYRKDLFYRVGIDPDDPPENWDELYDYAKRMTIPSEGIYGLYLASGPQASYDWITYLWSAGGDAVLQKDNGDWFASFNSEAGVDAMEMYLKLITTNWLDADGEKQRGFVIREGDYGRMFSDGKIGMMMTYMNEKTLGGELDPNLYGVAPPPKGPTGIRGSEINCRMMGIFSGAGESNNGGIGDRDPQKVREAAWNYIKFYDSEEARKIRLRVMIDAGFGKMQNPLYLKKYGYEEYLKYTPTGWLNTFEEAVENGKPEPYGSNCQKIYEYMTYPIDNCISLEESNALGATTDEKRIKIREILDGAAKRTNEKMIGKVSIKERTRRNRIASVVAFFVFTIFLFALYKVWKIFTPNIKYQQKIQQKKKYYFAYLMLVPALASIIMWKYVPMFMGSIMAFQDYNIVGASHFNGIQNFADVLFDPVWWAALGKTLYYMTLSLSLGFVPPIILAILLQEVSHGKLIYRVIYYLPAVISGVIVIYLWKLLYDPSDA